MVSSSPFSGTWWREKIPAVVALAPTLWLPAGLLTIANIVGVLTLQSVSQLMSGDATDLQAVGQAVGTGSLGLLAMLVLLFWSLLLWLMRLTAFCRCVVTGRKLDRRNLSAALRELKGKRTYLSKVWAVASLWVLLPITPLTMLMSIRMIATSKLALDTIGIEFSPFSMLLINGGIALLVFVLAAFSLLVLALSARLSLAPSAVSREAMSVFAGNLPQVAALTLVAVLLNLISSPISAVATAPGVSLENVPISIQLGMQLWTGASSCILWPLSVLPFCELVPGEVAR